MSQRRLTPPCRYVYVIGPETGLQKIGVATDPRAGLAALQTESLFRLVMHAAVSVPFGAVYAVERQAPEVLRRVCATGEWFSATPAEAVAAVRVAAAPFEQSVGTVALPLFDFAAATETAPKLDAPLASRGLARLWDVGCGMWDVGCGMWHDAGLLPASNRFFYTKCFCKSVMGSRRSLGVLPCNYACQSRQR